MSPWRSEGRKVYKLRVPTPHGGWVVRSTGTTHGPTARAMQRMLATLGPRGQRAWDLLRAVVDRRLTVARLYDAYQENALAALRARLDDLDLLPVYREWMEWLAVNKAPLTVVAYRTRLKRIVPQGNGATWPRSSLTVEAVQEWLRQVPGNSTNKQGNLVALQSFIAYARETKRIAGDPLEGLVRPVAKQKPIQFLELEDVLRVVEASEGRYRVLFALLHAAGLEISPALTLTRRHFDIPNRALRMPGTKNKHRDRSGIVAEWAWPIISPHLATMLPDAKVFGGLSRIKAGEHWRAVTRRLGIRTEAKGRGGVRMHDARHHWAIRMLRAGTPVEIVSGQLGHGSATMTLEIYGQFVPDYAELREWEARATAMDRLRATPDATRAVGSGGKLRAGKGLR